MAGLVGNMLPVKGKQAKTKLIPINPMKMECLNEWETSPDEQQRSDKVKS
jgi:hypothetical protein